MHVSVSYHFLTPLTTSALNMVFPSFTIIYHPVCLHCTFSEFGSVYLSLQVVPELLISFDALLQLLSEELHRCQLQL